MPKDFKLTNENMVIFKSSQLDHTKILKYKTVKKSVNISSVRINIYTYDETFSVHHFIKLNFLIVNLGSGLFALI